MYQSIPFISQARIQKTSKNIRTGLKFLGKRSLIWSGIVVMSSTTLALVELAIAAFIQLFLKSLKILSVDLGWVNRIFPENVDIKIVALSLVGIAVIRSAALYFNIQGNNIANESLNYRLRLVSVYDLLLNPAQSPVSSADMSYRLGEMFPKAALFCNHATGLMGFCIQAFVMSALLIVIGWRESVVALTGLAIIGTIIVFINRRIRQISATIPQEHAFLSQGIERVARNWLLVRILKTQKREHHGFQHSIEAYSNRAIRGMHYGALSAAGAPFLGILLLILIIYFSQNVFFTSGVSLLSFLYLFVRFVQLLSQMAGSLSWISLFWPQFRSAFRFFGSFSEPQIRHALSPATHQTLPVCVQGVDKSPPQISVQNVSFQYQSSLAYVLNQVNLTIPKGALVGIVGQSGSGKSTLLNLILGLNAPTSGIVTVDGRDPKDYFQSNTIRIGYVGAESFLIAGTVDDNLRYGLQRDASQADIWTALTLSKLSDFVKSLPQGLDYPISPTGEGLSAGQKQRLCLARALVNKPQLLILDEVSANLDTETELEIAESLKGLKGICTTLIVSHRNGILKHADSVLNMASV